MTDPVDDVLAEVVWRDDDLVPDGFASWVRSTVADRCAETTEPFERPVVYDWSDFTGGDL
jgi:hypothetical protein